MKSFIRFVHTFLALLLLLIFIVSCSSASLSTSTVEDGGIGGTGNTDECMNGHEEDNGCPPETTP